MFARMQTKILMVIGLTVALGLLGLLAFYSDREEQNILAQHRRALLNLVQSTEQGLRTLMLSGYGDAGPVFAESIENLGQLLKVQVLRVDGREAFTDNETIRAVNARLGFAQFELRERETTRQLLPSMHAGLRTALYDGKVIDYVDVTGDGDRLLTLLAPIHHDGSCDRCHVANGRYRGLIKLTSSLVPVDASIRASREQSLAILIVTLLLIIAAVSLFLNRSVIPPIRAVTRAMRLISGGDLAQTIAVPRQVELASIAQSFNYMARELAAIYGGLQRERDKLTTIILGAQEGIVLTDRDGKVVLVNPACEPLLEKDTETIAKGGLPELFDDPAWVADRLGNQDPAGSSDARYYRDRVLHVHLSSIRNEQGQPIGSAALIRDITQEHRLRERLRNQSLTDALTGAFNRRHFDLALEAEHARAHRYATPMAVVMCDIDHFKEFNDRHGHEQGDRVLQAVAGALASAFRDIDAVCRYGGEEFAVVMPEVDASKAGEQAEWARETLEQLRVDGLQVTASFGVAHCDGSVATSAEALLKSADEALYEAKLNGRNRVCLQRSG